MSCIFYYYRRSVISMTSVVGKMSRPVQEVPQFPTEEAVAINRTAAVTINRTAATRSPALMSQLSETGQVRWRLKRECERMEEGSIVYSWSIILEREI